ncbi:MAG: hypothetical protein HQL87_12540 [Magnetococcales bacterium]|nr:hypothetical protein [Magnetococcales bacterium]
MRQEPTENSDPKRLENLPQLSLAEAAWMAGVTPDSFERFLEVANLGPVRSLPILDLVRAGFTLLGQREAQLAMFRLQLAAALQREKELTEALQSQLTAGMAVLSVSPPPPAPQPVPQSVQRSSGTAFAPAVERKAKKRGKKK